MARRASDELPAEFLRRVLQNEDLDLAARIDAAKAGAGFFSPKLASVHMLAQTKGQYWISDKPLTPEEWEAEYCTEKPDGEQMPSLTGAPHKLETELRDKRIDELEEEIPLLS
jgi:hypothetical protein